MGDIEAEKGPDVEAEEGPDVDAEEERDVEAEEERQVEADEGRYVNKGWPRKREVDGVPPDNSDEVPEVGVDEELDPVGCWSIWRLLRTRYWIEIF